MAPVRVREVTFPLCTAVSAMHPACIPKYFLLLNFHSCLCVFALLIWFLGWGLFLYSTCCRAYPTTALGHTPYPPPLTLVFSSLSHPDRLISSRLNCNFPELSQKLKSVNSNSILVPSLPLHSLQLFVLSKSIESLIFPTFLPFPILLPDQVYSVITSVVCAPTVMETNCFLLAKTTSI